MKCGFLCYSLLIIKFFTRYSIAQTSLLPMAMDKLPDSTRMWTLREIGDSLVSAGQFMPAKQAYEQALALAQTRGDQKAVGLAYRGLGYWYESTGDYGQAIDWYQQALAVFKLKANQKQFARTLRFISFCYDRLHDDQQALSYIKQSIAIAQKEQYTDLLMECYEGIAAYEAKQNQYRQALAHRQKVLEYYKARHDSMSYYSALYNVGLLYKNMGQYVRAEQLFEQVLDYAKQHHDAYMAGFVYVSLPYALIPQNKLDEAEKYCRLALDWVAQTGTEKQMVLEEVNGHLTHIWEKRGNFGQALHYYRQQMASHDSVFNAIRSHQITELETRYQTREKEDHIRQLTEINILQNRQIWASVGGLLVLVLLLGAMYHLYERVRKSRQKIQQQSDQLSLMMKELHHRAKNNLAIISSLLFLQTTHLDDDDMIQVIRVGQQRVEAMSLIHQRLYQSNQVTTVNMVDYLTDLAEGLLRAYGYQVSAFDLQLDIELTELDVDIAIPLGLIVNELLTNSFKHAYAAVRYPFLRIGLYKTSGSHASELVLEVQDNGPGIDLTDWQRYDQRSSFGKQLIQSLSQQLDGHFDLVKRDGTLFRLRIPESFPRA